LAVGLVLLGALSSCISKEAPAPVATAPSEEAESGPETAVAAGVAPGPAIGGLGLTEESARRALAAFRISCPALLKRADPSGLTRPEDWSPACAAASGWPDRDALSFFSSHFEAARIGDGTGLATGYFEPQIAGSRNRSAGYSVPVYGVPEDLVEAELGQFSDSLEGRRIRGRVDGRKFIPYYDRAAIEDGALADRGLEIGWAADPIDLFFLEIQGSGQLRLPDGSVMRIGYAGQNGRGYVAIGRLMKERGLLQPGKTTMQDIVAWLRQNPEEGRAIMRENKSYIFFREIQGPGPIGALGVPVTARGTVAADPKFVPLGAPVVLDFDRAEADGLWIAQDTGGAIKGPNRFDTFWGAGEEAARIAGGMSAQGDALILLPKGSIGRATGGNDPQAGR
jgi:membrane-bound lytic murein transglycosylase A